MAHLLARLPQTDIESLVQDREDRLALFGRCYLMPSLLKRVEQRLQQRSAPRSLPGSVSGASFRVQRFLMPAVEQADMLANSRAEVMP